MSSELALLPFRYPVAMHQRRHGPSGYKDYKSFKPWLRDEFLFRCVFCLLRERWFPYEADFFGVDHLVPKTERPDLECNYENLLYCCNRCNSAKQIKRIIDPCSDPLGNHLEVVCNGTVKPRTKEGVYLIRAFNLNHKRSVAFRRRKIESLVRWEENGDTWSIHDALGFPEEMPDLSQQTRCQNSRPDGVRNSYFERHQRNELEPTY